MPKDLVYNVKVKFDDSALKRGQQQVASSNERVEKSVQDVTKEIREQIRFLDLQREKGSVTARELVEEYSRLERQLEKLPQSFRGTVAAQERLISSQRRVNNSIGATRNTVSGANQTLFSFGDIINDSQQFQLSFAAGSRAIGNNIAFMSEQFSHVISRAGGFTAGIKAMGASMLGPGGIIIGINLAVSALTIFGDKLFSAKEEAKNLKEELTDTGGVVDAIDKAVSAMERLGAFGEDPGGTDASVERIRRLQESIREEQLKLNEAIDIEREFRQDILDARQITHMGIVRHNEELEKQLEILGSSEEIQERIKVLETEIEEESEELAANYKAQNDEQVKAARAAKEARNATKEQVSLELGVLSQAAQDRIQSRLMVASTEEMIEKDIQNVLDQQAKREKDRIKEVEESHLLSIERRKQAALAAERIAQREAERMARERFMRISTIAGLAGQAISALFSQSKTAAIASAIINGAQAITRTFAEYGFTPFGIGAAAAQAAVTAAQIAKIQRTTVESTGGGGADSGGASQGFEVSNVSQSSSGRTRSSTNIQNISQAGARDRERERPINVILAGEFDDRVVSIKAERGRRLRENKVTAVRD